MMQDHGCKTCVHFGVILSRVDKLWRLSLDSPPRRGYMPVQLAVLLDDIWGAVGNLVKAWTSKMDFEIVG